MAETNYIEAIKDLLVSLQQITIEAMAQAGVKQSSDLSKSVTYSLTPDGIQMEAAEYYPWVSDGHAFSRRARLRRVPLNVLIEWIKEKGLVPNGGKTINQLAWAIQTSIYQRGIRKKMVKGKNFADTVATNVGDYTADKLADELALIIADDLVEMFAPVTV